MEREAKKIQQEPSHIAEGIQGKGLTLGEEEAARLDAQPKIKVYRAMQEHDGKLYPPTSGMIQEEYTDKNGDEKTDEKERYDRASGAAEPVTEEEAALRDAVSGLLRNAGIEVIDDVEEGQRVLDRANEVLLSKDKKRALETASLGETSRSLTVIPSALGSKILNNLDTLVTKCKNSSTQPKTFIGEVADALGIPQERFKDKSSQYATFETKNGNIVTIRISDHNATAPNLDVNGQEDVISIVVSNKPNKGINNDGKSHIVEYYYNAIKLRKADGKPLAAIVRSIQQALYSSEYKDTTGLAERQEVNAVDVIKYYRSQRSKLNGRAMARRGRGYVEEENGRLISRRAKEAEEDGSFPKQKFISHYKVSNRGFRLLSKLGLIGYAGWHHTGNSFKKTDYYGWSEEPFADAYSKNKKDLEEIEKRLEETPVNEGDGIQSDAGRLLERYCDLMGYHDEIREFHIKLYLQDAYREKQLNEALKELGLDSKDVKFFRTQNGEAYGFIAGGKIYLDPRIAKADTPIHEYTHLWTEALRNANPKEWQNVVELMKDTWAWDYVKESYPELEGDDEIADEALTHFSGRQGAERLREAAKDEIAKADGILGEAAVWSAFNKVKTALKNFWRGVADFLHIHFTSAEEVADRVMYDLLNRVKPGGDRSYSSNRRYREDRSDSTEDVEAVNERFNEELEKYERGEVPIGTRFELGMPSKELESAGFPYLPISMRASLLSKKAGMERHPFAASDLRGLVSLQKPIAIFKYSKDNMRNLIVDVMHGGKHFLVGVTFDYKAGGIEVNSVSGLFPKDSHEWIKWIQDGKAIRIDQKKKVLDLIDSLRTNPAESERIGLNLSSAAKIINPEPFFCCKDNQW